MSRGPILLTGATGFVGMELLVRLLERGDRDVVALVRARDDREAQARMDGVLEHAVRPRRAAGSPAPACAPSPATSSAATSGSPRGRATG